MKNEFKYFFVKELEKLNPKFTSILDVGTGRGEIAEYFIKKGKDVYSTTLCPESYNRSSLVNPVICDIEKLQEVFGDNRFDVVWMWNVLEHVPNLKISLNNVYSVLKDDGYLMMTVPEFENYVNGGHMTQGWNIGYLMYVLLVHGFDIKNGKFIHCNRQIVALVKKGEIPNVELRQDHGDINLLKDYFPIDVFDGFNGKIKSVNWDVKFGSELKIKLADFYTYIKRNYLKKW